MSGIMMALIGSSNSPFALFAGATINKATLSPANATAALDLNSDGTCSRPGDSPASLPNWFSPTTTGIGSSYWAKATISSGSFSSGSGTGIVSLSGGAGWTRSQTAVGSSSVTFTVEIFSDSGGVNKVAQATFTITATKDA